MYSLLRRDLIVGDECGECQYCTALDRSRLGYRQCQCDMGCRRLLVHSHSNCSNRSVANGCFLLTSGRLADLYGRRRVFFIGSLLTLIFTVLCGVSQNGIMLFVFRAFQGIGSAICVPGAVGIVGATYHRYNKRKAMAFAVIGGIATAGFLGGILLGGICSQLLTWRWLFYITAIINVIMIAIVFFIVPRMAGEEENPAQKRRQKWKEIDWWGQVLSISGLVCLTFSLTYTRLKNFLMVDIRRRLRKDGLRGTFYSS